MGCCMEAAKGGIISPAPMVFISLTIHMVNHLQQLSTIFNNFQPPSTIFNTKNPRGRGHHLSFHALNFAALKE